MFSDPDQTAASRLKRCFGVVPTKSTVKTPVLIILSRLNSIPLTVAVYASCQHLCRLRKTRFRWVANPCRTGLNTCRDTKRCFIIFIYICSPYKSPPHGFARRNGFRFSVFGFLFLSVCDHEYEVELVLNNMRMIVEYYSFTNLDIFYLHLTLYHYSIKFYLPWHM
jgi:hypothetical protein